jgi:putative endonuclease
MKTQKQDLTIPITHDIGRRGEKVAATYLTRAGYEILGTNIRTSYGEIDLLTRKNNVLVFVEVKTRRSATLGFPEISITAKKFTHMVAAAEAYLQQHPEYKLDWQLDVIAIYYPKSNEAPQIAHFENVTDVR